jgi:DNA-3-methyladenine glycosylase II
VVVGYRQELLQPAIAAWARRHNMTLRVVQNPVWLEGNGTSALAVAPYLSQAFFLLMCDHVFTPAMLEQLQAAEDGTEVCRLAVDRRVAAIFDLPDATKVRLDGSMITAIGKDIVPFDAIDTGLFLCRPFLFKALEHARAAGDSSLSGGMRQLLSTGQLRAVDIGEHFWSDVDTPESLAYTERALTARLTTSQALPHHAEAVAHLQQADPVLGRIIAHCGPCTLQPRDLEPLVMLCRSIIYQQLSGKAAGTIMTRFLGLYAPDVLTPAALLRTTDDTLRGIGLSRQKIAYLKDLALQIQDGVLQLTVLPTHSDADVIRQLVGVKGIGRWTAEMFLIFALGRPDVFPVDDLGIRKAIQRAYGYKRLPAPVTMHRHARKWIPYRTIATWYLWRSLDGAIAPLQETPGAG